MRSLHAALNNSKIGELLVLKGVITCSELRHALEEHKSRKIPLGQILIERNVLSKRTLALILLRQKALRVVAGTMLFFQGPRGLITVPVRPRLISNNIDMLVLAVKNGNGLGVLSKPAAKPLIDDGSVVLLLQNYPLPVYWLRACVPQTRTNLARVKVMLEHIRNALLPIPPWERD